MEELWKYMRQEGLYSKGYQEFQQQFPNRDRLEVLRKKLMERGLTDAQNVDELLDRNRIRTKQLESEAQKVRRQQEQQQPAQIEQPVQPSVPAPFTRTQGAPPPTTGPVPKPGSFAPRQPGQPTPETRTIQTGITAPAEMAGEGPGAIGRTAEDARMAELEAQQEEMGQEAAYLAAIGAGNPMWSAVQGWVITGGALLGQTARGLSEAAMITESVMSSYWNMTPGLWQAGYARDLVRARQGQREGVSGALSEYADYKQQQAEIRSMYADTESILFKIGSVIPSVTGVAAAMAITPYAPAAGAAIGTASITQLGLAAVGSGIESYDGYKKKNNQPIDPTARLGVGLLYGAAEFAMERLQLGKFLTPVQKAALRGKMGNMIFGAVPLEAQEKMAKELFEEFAKQNTKGARLLEGVKRAGQGFLDEAPGEAFTAVAQEFTDWLYQESKDRSSWTDVLKNAAESFALGGLMGAGLGGLSYGMSNIATKRRREEAGKVIIAQNKETGEAVEIVGESGTDDKGNKKYRGVRPNGRDVEVTENNIGNTYVVKTADFNALLKGMQDGSKIREATAMGEAKPPTAPPHIGENITMPTGQKAVVSRLQPDGTYVAEDEEGNEIVMTREEIDPLRNPEETDVLTRDVPRGAEIIDRALNPQDTKNQVYRAATTEELTEGLGEEQTAGIANLHRMELMGALEGGAIVRDIKDGILSPQRAQQIFASAGISNELNKALTEAGIETAVPIVNKSEDLVARRDKLQKEIDDAKANPPFFLNAWSQTQHNLELEDKAGEVAAINEQLKNLQDGKEIQVQQTGEETGQEGGAGPQGPGGVDWTQEAGEGGVSEAGGAGTQEIAGVTAQKRREALDNRWIHDGSIPPVNFGEFNVFPYSTRMRYNPETEVPQSFNETTGEWENIDLQKFERNARIKGWGPTEEAVSKQFEQEQKTTEEKPRAVTSTPTGLSAEETARLEQPFDMRMDDSGPVAVRFEVSKSGNTQLIEFFEETTTSDGAKVESAGKSFMFVDDAVSNIGIDRDNPDNDAFFEYDEQQRDERGVDGNPTLVYSISENLETGQRSANVQIMIKDFTVQLLPKGTQPSTYAPATPAAPDTDISSAPADIAPPTAAQEATGEVPVQPETIPGEEVAQGEPQAEPQGAAQEGAQEEVVPVRSGFGTVTNYTVQKNADGDITRILDAKGNEVPKTVTRRGKTRANDVYTRVKNAMTGAMSDAAIRQQRDREISAAMDVPYDARTAAEQAIFNGAKVSRASLRGEVGKDADKASWHGMQPENKLPSISGLATRIWEDAASEQRGEPSFTDQDVRNALIDIYSEHYDMESLKEDMYRKMQPPEQMFSQQEQDAIDGMTEPDTDLTGEELQDHYDKQADAYYNSLTDEEKAEYDRYADEVEREGAQGPTGEAGGDAATQGETRPEIDEDIPPFMAEGREPSFAQQAVEKAKGIILYLRDVVGLGSRIVIPDTQQDWQNILDDISGDNGVLFGILDDIDLFDGDVAAAKKFIDHVFSTVADADAKTAYRKMSFKYHPDRPGGATEVMQHLTNAWAKYQAGGYKYQGGTKQQNNQGWQQQHQNYQQSSANKAYDEAKKRAEEFERKRQEAERKAKEEEARKKEEERRQAEREREERERPARQHAERIAEAKDAFDSVEKNQRSLHERVLEDINKQHEMRVQSAGGDKALIELFTKDRDQAILLAKKSFGLQIDAAKKAYADRVRISENILLKETDPEEWRKRENARANMRQEQERIRREEPKRKRFFFFKTDGTRIIGFVHNGKMYLNPEKLNPEAVLHENQHLWQDGVDMAARQFDVVAMAINGKREELFGKVADSVVAGERFTNTYGIDLTNPAYSQKDGESDYKYRERIIREIEAYVIGRYMNGQLQDVKDSSPSLWKRLTEYMQMLADWIASKTGLKGRTPEQIFNMSLEEYVKAAGFSAMKGEFVVSGNPVVREIKSLPLTRVRGLKMGQNEAAGSYISTERVNRYADQGTPVTVDVAVQNPIKLNEPDLFERRRQVFPEAKKRFLNRLSEQDRAFLEPMVSAAETFDADELSIAYSMGFGRDLAQAVTDSYIDEGYDSIYIPETPSQEGMLIVFDRGNVMHMVEQEPKMSQEQQEIKRAAVADGSFMKAPNGKDSKLNEFQWTQVRTTAFTNWFGDWRNNPESASKVVDENGEPLVVYHGTNAEFDNFVIGWDVNGDGAQNLGIFFGEIQHAKSVEGGTRGQAYTGLPHRIIDVYLSIKNPLRVNKDAKYWFSPQRVSETIGTALDVAELNNLIRKHEEKGIVYTRRYENAEEFEVENDTIAEIVRPWLIKNGYDGVVYPNEVDAYGEEEAYGFSYISFDPNQIKSAFDSRLSGLRSIFKFQLLAEARAKAVERTSEALEKAKAAFPNIEVVTDPELIDAAIAEAVAEGSLEQVEGYEIPAFVWDGKVYLDPRLTDTEAEVHEFGHIWNTWLKMNDPAAYRRGLELVKGSAYEAYVRSIPGYENMSEEAILDEALATAIGKKGAALYADRSKMGKFRKWLADLWDSVRKMFKGSPSIENMTLDEFVNKAVKDLTAGKPISTATSADIARADMELQPMFLNEVNASKALGHIVSADAAKKMEAAGKDPKVIEATTGWVKGPDGVWKQRVDFLSDMSLKREPREGDKLGDILDAPSLFEAFPEAAQIPVGLVDGPFEAAYNFTGIEINPKALGKDSLLSEIYHEIQHYFQHREGLISPENIGDLSASEALLWSGIGGFPQEWADYTDGELITALDKMYEDLKESDPVKANMAWMLSTMYREPGFGREFAYSTQFAEVQARAAQQARGFYETLDAMGLDPGQVWHIKAAAESKSLGREAKAIWRPSREKAAKAASYASTFANSQNKFMESEAFMGLVNEAFDAMDNGVESFQRFSDLYGLESRLDAYNAWVVARQMRQAKEADPFAAMNMLGWREQMKAAHVDQIMPVKTFLQRLGETLGFSTGDTARDLELYKSASEDKVTRQLERIFGPLRGSFFTGQATIEELSGDKTSVAARARKDGISLNSLGEYMALKHAPFRNARVREMREKVRAEYIGKLQEMYDAAVAAGLTNRANAIQRVIAEAKANNYSDSLWEGKYAEMHPEAVVGVSEINNTDIGSGISDAEADARLNELAPDDATKERYDGYAEEIRQALIIDRLNDQLAEGLITQQQYDALINGTREGFDSVMEHYVPLAVKDELLGAVTSEGYGGGVGIFSLVGTERFSIDERKNPIAVLADQYASIQRTISRNRIMKQLASEIIKANAIAAANGQGSYFKLNGEKAEGMEATMEDAGTIMLDGTIKKGRFPNAWQRSKYIRENSITYIVDGKTRMVTFPRHEYEPGKFKSHPIIEAFQNENPPEWMTSKWYGKAITLLTNAKRQLYTQANFWFGIFNFMGDNLGKMVNLGRFKDVNALKTTLLSVARGGSIRTTLALLDPMKLDKETLDYYNEYQRVGGFMTWANKNKVAQSAEEFQKLMDDFDAGNPYAFFRFRSDDSLGDIGRKQLMTYRNILKKGYTMVGAFNDALENGTRMSTYISLRKQGKTPQEAAYVAKNLTVNFETKGRTTKKVEPFYLFYGVAWQGAYMAWKVFSSKRAWTGVIAANAGLVAANRALLHLAMDDDEKEKELLNQHIYSGQGERYMLIANPFDSEPLRIRKPYGPMRLIINTTEAVIDVGAGMKTPTQAMLEVVASSKEAFIPYVGEASNKDMESLVPAIAPTLIKTEVEVAVNMAWYGSPIVPQFGLKTEDGKAWRESEFYTKKTGPIYVELAKRMEEATRTGEARQGVIDISPNVLEYYAKQASGGLIKQTMDAVMAFEGARNYRDRLAGVEELDKDGFDFTKFPLTKATYVKLDGKTQGYYWALKDAIERSATADITKREAKFLDNAIDKLMETGWMTRSKAKQVRKELAQKYKAFDDLD